MEDQIPTVRSRALGAAARQAREKSGRDRHDFANRIGMSRSAISRFESGKRDLTETRVTAWFAVCGVTGAALDEALDLYRRGHEQQRCLLVTNGQCDDTLPILLREEASAVRISEYEPLALPSLLQTEDYARAVLERVGLTPDHAVDHRVRARMQRQAIFRQSRQPVFQFYISEHILRCPVGSSRVMNDQLQHMALVSTLPHCAIRITPIISSGTRLTGPFRLMEYVDYDPVVYLHNLTTGLFLEEPSDIYAYRTVLALLNQLALTPDQSTDLLLRLADNYDQPSDPNPSPPMERAPQSHPPTEVRTTPSAVSTFDGAEISL